MLRPEILGKNYLSEYHSRKLYDMISIVRATIHDVKFVADIGKQTFLQSHSTSAKKSDIDTYVNDKYNDHIVKEELADINNLYHLIYVDDQLAGYSKIILNCSHPNIASPQVTKLERLYVLNDFYDQKIGLALFSFNMELAKQHNQSGIWLFVWTENERAIHFYKRVGFKIIGSHDFKISETHSNPNHQMLLTF